MPVRLRRSVLCVPPRLEKAVSVAKTCDADTLIFDLEDAVAPIHKADARAMLTSTVQEGGFGGKEVGIRCNGLGTEWVEEDIRAIASSGVDFCMIPKVESGEDIQEVRRILKQYHAPPEMEVWAMVETPLGVLHAQDIAASSSSSSSYPLRALVIGSADLTKALKGLHTSCRHPLIPSLHMVLLAARAHGLVAIDGVHFRLDNAQEFAAHCQQGVELGFDGKTLLHPVQINKCNELFARRTQSAAPQVDPSTYSTEWAYQVDTWGCYPAQ